MALTFDQQNAVDVRDRTLLVSAAAGSGKTYTLTQRVIKAIIEDGKDISRLLIVTFTRAAAGELKAKISKAIGEAIVENPDNVHLQKQLIKLGNSHISTIDSFFAEPVRANFEKLGLPASMRMSDEAELASVRERIMGEVLESFFDSCDVFSDRQLADVGYSDRYTSLVSVISEARDGSKLIPTLCDIYKKLMTSPAGIGQLSSHAKRLAEDSKKPFFDTAEGKAMLESLENTASYVFNALLKACDELAAADTPCDKYVGDFEQSRQLCSAIIDALKTKDYETIRQAFNDFTPKSITSISKNIQTEKSVYYKNLRTSLHGEIKDVRAKYLYKSEDELLAILSVYSDISYLLADILGQFDRKYSDEKLNRGVCEFSDMPRFMLSLLLDKDGNPTDYANRLSDSFDEVYIDEYQDVNEIQDTIFRLIGKNRRFMVGDIKQSIYGFREAEPSIFADYRRKFALYDNNNDVAPMDEFDGNTIFMSNNFRCDDNIIKFANEVCSTAFSAFAESIGYTEQDNLRFSKKVPEGYVGPKVSVNIVHRFENEVGTEDNTEIEAEASEDPRESYKDLSDEAIIVANQIADLLRNGKNADGSPVRAGHIAVLVRGNKHSRPLMAALKRLNIKYLVSSKGELFDSEDMRMLVDLLSVIDNPRVDIPLCHLLTAQHLDVAATLSLEEVITVRRHAEKSKSLFDALISYSESGEDEKIAHACREFLSLIEKLRATASKVSADKLIKSLVTCEKFAYLTTTAAYTYLYDCACKYVKNTWSGLYNFLKYFKELMEKGEGGAEPEAKTEDAVTIMTAHQSKGLEFNVCFLLGFGKSFYLRDRFPLIFRKEFGISMKLPPINQTADNKIDKLVVRHEENPIHKMVVDFNRNAQIEEEARILYVALTRARERLYVSATMTGYISHFLKSLEGCADPSYEIRKGGSYIKWILLALLHSTVDTSQFCDINFFYRGEQYLTDPFPRTTMAELNNNASVEDIELAEIIARPEREDEMARICATVPSKVAASKVSPHMLDDSVFIPIPTGMLFSEGDDDQNAQSSDNERRIRQRIDLMRSAKKDFDSLLDLNKKPTAAERGTATHLFLQYCDYNNAATNGLDHEIQRLRDARFISARTCEILNRDMLERFFSGEIYSLIKNAQNVRREFRFGMFKSAASFTQNGIFKELLADKKIFVQGSIDLIIEQKNGDIVLCDYKTDRISPEELNDRTLLIESMRTKHGEQLEQYRHATEQIFGRAPSRICIYSLPLGELIDM